MHNNKGLFKKLIVENFDKLSDWLKEKTTQNSQDWVLALLFIMGSLYIFSFSDKIELKDILTVTVLWLTFIAIMWYTKETFWLKQVQQKQLHLEIDEKEDSKKMRTINLLDQFNTSLAAEFAYVISDDFKKEFTISAWKEFLGNKLEWKEKEPALKLNRILAYFEKAGLMLRYELIEFQIFYEVFMIEFPNFYNNLLIQSNIEASKERLGDEIWSDLEFLKSEFEKKLKK